MASERPPLAAGMAVLDETEQAVGQIQEVSAQTVLVRVYQDSAVPLEAVTDNRLVLPLQIDLEHPLGVPPHQHAPPPPRRERPALQPVLQALASLNDPALHTVLCRAQGLLLDRSVPTPAEDPFLVAIVTRDEWYLLAAYRALPPGTQQDAQGDLAQLRAPAQGRVT